MCVYCDYDPKDRGKINFVVDVDCKRELASVEITRGDIMNPTQSIKLTALEVKELVKELTTAVLTDYDGYAKKLAGAA